jgi:hypothetical protein
VEVAQRTLACPQWGRQPVFMGRRCVAEMWKDQPLDAQSNSLEAKAFETVQVCAVFMVGSEESVSMLAGEYSKL